MKQQLLQAQLDDLKSNNQAFVRKINWKLLVEQKQTLLSMSTDLTDNSMEQDHINGIIGFIDYIQDYAVDALGVPEDVIFPDI
jgi:hypothetical protein